MPSALYYLRELLIYWSLFMFMFVAGDKGRPDENKSERVPVYTNNSVLTIELLLNGTIQELKSITKQQVVRSMWAITKIDLPLIKKLVIWDIIKENKPSRLLQRKTLQATGNFILSISDTDLYDLNMSDWNIVDYLGTLRGLSRKQVGIIAYALKNEWGDSVITTPDYINRMKGILCGFSPQDINSISAPDFYKISRAVFENIGACTTRQKNVLLRKAMMSSAYGPPQAWTSTDTEKLGLLISAMDKDNLPRIRPAAMEGIVPDTIRAMEKEQLDQLNDEQIDFLSDLSLTAYRAVERIASDRQVKIVASKVLIGSIFVFCCLCIT